MRVVCPDPEAPEDESRYAKSTPLWIGENDATIQYQIDRTIPHLSFKHRVYRPQHDGMGDMRRDGFLLVVTMEGID